MSKCFIQLKKEGWDIAFHIDPDEYFTLNHRLFEPEDPMYNANISKANLTMSRLSEPCSIADFLHDIEPFHQSVNGYTYGGPCREFPRLQFSSYEDDESRSKIPTIPGFATHQMNTQRYHYLRRRRQKIGKGVVALSKVLYSALRGYTTPHHPIGKWKENRCFLKSIRRPEYKSPIVINHYPSDWNSLLFRQNQQRIISSERFTRRFKEEQSRHENEQPRTDIQMWLSDFIKIVGKTDALKLLELVGDPSGAAQGAKIHWDHNATLATPSEPQIS